MNELFNNVYKGKKVLVTGHTGFKGAWLSLCLTMIGAEVIGFSLKPHTEPNLFNILKLPNHLTSSFGDIRNKFEIENIIKYHNPDFIFHLAAQSLVRTSYHNPHLTFETNIMGVVNLLEAIRTIKYNGIVINITSDKCYDNKEFCYSFKETDPMGGNDPYSASKGASEIITASYRNSFFHPDNYNVTHKLALASARAGNVIGGGDWSEDRLIPDIVRALSINKEISIRNPDAIRPWQHVLDCISGYLILGAILYKNPVKYSEGWNFGPDANTTMTVEQILLKSIKLWGRGNYKILPENIFKEASLLKLDITKAKDNLKYKQIYNIDQALEKTINWYKNYYSGNVDMIEFTKSQVNEYLNLN